MSKSVVDKGPWHHGVTQDGKRHFVQSEDFRHDTRLYIDGDFAGTNDKERYAKGIATQLNAAPVAAQPDADKVDADPLQGAADWLVKECGVKYIAELARRLSIGYNRATRLMETARKEQA